MKHPDWQRRLIDVIKAAEKRPFLWGENDCCLFAADCAQAMCGQDFASDLRGTYSTAVGAKRVLLNAGGSIEKLLAQHLDEVPVNLRQRGDIAVVISGGSRCAGVVFGGAVFVPGESGLVKLSGKPESIWRVR